MDHSPTLGKLFERIAAAQKRVKAAVKGSVNPHFKSEYADIAAIEEAMLPFAEEGVARLQLVSTTDDRAIRVTTVFGCAEGEWIAIDAVMAPERPGPHAFGSAVTYLRRYQMAAMGALATASDDDDGNAASAGPANTQSPRPQSKADPKVTAKTEAKADKTSLRVLATWMAQALGEPTAEDKQRWLDWVKVKSGFEVAHLADLPQHVVQGLVEAARQEVAEKKASKPEAA